MRKLLILVVLASLGALVFLVGCCPFEHDDDEICEFSVMFNTKQMF